MSLKEKCGVCGISCEKNAEFFLYKMLVQMQHRGQLSAGITTYHSQEPLILKTHKDLGLVNNVFRAEHKGKFSSIMEQHSSKIGIGHVRYATSGCDDKSYAQPFERMHGKKSKWFSFAFNGNIANYAELEKELKKSNYHLIRETDTEILEHLLAKGLKDYEDPKVALAYLAEKADGAYCISFVNAEGALIAARDPHGIRPLAYSIEGNRIGFASETVALQSIGFTDFHDLPPGHMLVHKNGETKVEAFCKPAKRAHCFFEWIYFAHPASVIEGKLVYDVRNKLGRELAKLETQSIDKDCVVVPVPDSSTPAGEGFSDAIGVPLKEGLIRNRYLGRTFIESSSREDKVKDKYVVIRQLIEGKKVFLVEDSIVRGTTLRNLIEYIRRVGKPREIHVRVACPPIKSPCFYGIDMSSKKQLIAGREENYEQMIESVRKEIGSDTLIYQTFEGLYKSIGFDDKALCTGCISGSYPTPAGEKLKNFDGEGRACGR